MAMKSLSYEETVEGWRWGLKQAAGRLAYRVFPVLSAGSLEIAAARWRSSEIPQLFSRNLRRIDPSLNDDLLDLYGASEQVLANRFTFLNRAHQFPHEVNWRLPESLAWLGELHAFDFGLDLAMTYRISGEE